MKILKKWEEVTEDLKEEFIRKYFGKNLESDIYWVGDIIGGVLCIGDYFFDLDYMMDSIRYNVSAKKMFDYYDKTLELAMRGKKPSVNYMNYIKGFNL